MIVTEGEQAEEGGGGKGGRKRGDGEVAAAKNDLFKVLFKFIYLYFYRKM